MRGARPLSTLAILAGLFVAQPALAQSVCERLDRQLASVGSGGDPRADEAARRIEQSIRRQEDQLSRAANDFRRMGCGRGGYGYYRGPDPRVCDEIDYHIGQMEENLYRLDTELARARADGTGGRERERQAIRNEMARYGCGEERREQRQANSSEGRPREQNLFSFLFGGGRVIEPGDQGGRSEQRRGRVPSGGTFRTLCVRERDGYYWPVSFATADDRFQHDAQVCRSSCPNQNVALYVHRNPGESSEDAVSLSGRPIGDLENAFLYREKYVAEAQCDRPEPDAIETASINQSEAQLMQASLTTAAPEEAEAEPAIRVTRLPVPRPDPDTPAEEVETYLTMQSETGASEDDGGQVPSIGTSEGRTVETDDGQSIRIVGPTFFPVQ